MPAWNDYKKEAEARGSLAYELYVVESTPQAAPEAYCRNTLLIRPSWRKKAIWRLQARYQI